MLPVVAGVALVGASIWIYNELQEQSAAERARWFEKREGVEKNIEWHTKQIEKHLEEATFSYEFKILVDTHYSCVNVANEAYALLKDARTSLQKIGEAIVKTAKQKNSLIKERDGSLVKIERQKFQEEINSLIVLKKNLFQSKNEIKKQRDYFQSRVKELNRKTHTLKINIKERTGNKGIQWYEKLEARKVARQSNKNNIKESEPSIISLISKIFM